MVIYGLGERKQDWWVNAKGERAKGVSGKLYCRSCNQVRRELYPRPIDISVMQLRPGKSIGSSCQLVIGFIHRRLLARLGEYMTDFAFGDVYDEAGKKLQNHRTSYSSSSIVIRGSADSEIRQCVICGEIDCAEQGDRYVVRHQLGDRHVFQDAGSTTYVDEWLAERIDWKEFKDIMLYPIPVREHPEDGWRLPGDPNWSAMGIPCKEWKSKVLNIPSLKNMDMGPWPPEGEKQEGSEGKAISISSPVLPAPLPAGQSIEFKYFAGPLADMAGYAGEDKACSLCGEQAPCFDLGEAICPELPQGDREGKVGCFDCLRAGRFEFVHNTEIGAEGGQGLLSGLISRLRPSQGVSKAAMAELRRTPRIVTNQEEAWRTHCNDLMVYQGVWEPGDFCEYAPDGDGRAVFLEMTDPDGHSLWEEGAGENDARAMWYGTYYVFKCRHCGKLRGNWDVD